jgi:A/G-specific adenine glycosylase
MAAPCPTATAAALERWFREHGRIYPWRETRDPYAILVSEVMLQQTQIATVLDRGFYSRWMSRFPNIRILAEAREEEVLSAWQGLGYYRRARNLHRLAQVIMNDHEGRFPDTPSLIRSLPGIGPYTAGAVASFAFGLAEPIVDGNVARVLSRLWDDNTPIDSTAGSRKLWQRAEAIVQVSDDPRSLNSALMELGQVVCRPIKPACMLCPLQQECQSKAPERLPVKKTKTTLSEITERVFFDLNPQGVALEQEKGSRRTGLWKLPALAMEEGQALPPVLLKANYGITRYKVTLWVHEAPAKNLAKTDLHRFQQEELKELPMPSPYRRALEKLLVATQHSLQVFNLAP